MAGVVSALLLTAAGLFWWQAEAGQDAQPLIARGGARAQTPSLPGVGDPNAKGAPPPAIPQADPRTREQKRFDRYDKDRNGIITRTEMMASRTAAFRKLDKDGNNLLSFEEWAARTSDRFATADVSKDGKLTPAEFATTAPKRSSSKPSQPPVCKCEDD